MRGGAFWTYRTGDHYSPQFRLTALGIFQYRVATGALGSGTDKRATATTPRTCRRRRRPGARSWTTGSSTRWRGTTSTSAPGATRRLDTRANLDLHLERMFDLRGRQLAVSLDMFNVTGDKAITQVNTMVNNGMDYYPDLAKPWTGVTSDQFFGSVLERVPPRTSEDRADGVVLRAGGAVRNVVKAERPLAKAIPSVWPPIA